MQNETTTNAANAVSQDEANKMLETRMKRCTKCGELLPITEFYRNVRMRDGYLTQCKKCHKKSVHDSYVRMRQKNVNKPLLLVCPELAKFTPRQLIIELRNRGYKGTLTYTNEIKL